MKPQSPSESKNEIVEQAALWLLTLQSEQVNEVQRAQFADWVRASPLHIAALLRVSRLHRDLRGFKHWQQILPHPELWASQIIQLPLPERQRDRPRRRIANALLAAGLAAVCLTGWLLVSRLQQTEYRTRPGERQQETLADGSQVELASNSDVVVRYRANERLITLKYGAALFRVAKNPNRPFIVQAALTRVRAVGTVFNVESGAQGVSVTVVEGRVSLSQQSATRFAASGDDITRPIITLGANEQVSISRAGVASTSHRDASDSAAPWIADQISFDNETVAEVSRRFNLRNTVNIEIQDPVLAARRISGMFRANDPQSFVAFIHAAAHAEVMQPDSTHIILVPEDNDNQRR